MSSKYSVRLDAAHPMDERQTKIAILIRLAVSVKDLSYFDHIAKKKNVKSLIMLVNAKMSLL